MWNPQEMPYRVMATYRSGAHGHHGWANGAPQVFATEADARNALAKLEKRRLIAAHIHRAENAATWMKNGRWALVQTFKPSNL